MRKPPIRAVIFGGLAVVALGACYKGGDSPVTDPEADCTDENLNDQGDIALHIDDELPCLPDGSQRLVVFDVTEEECLDWGGQPDTYEHDEIVGNVCVDVPYEIVEE